MASPNSFDTENALGRCIHANLQQSHVYNLANLYLKIDNPNNNILVGVDLLHP